MFTEPVIISLIAAAAALGGASLTYLSARQNRQQQRISELERTNRKLWRYTVELVNAIGKTGAAVPPPPAEISDLYG